MAIILLIAIGVLVLVAVSRDAGAGRARRLPPGADPARPAAASVVGGSPWKNSCGRDVSGALFRSLPSVDTIGAMTQAGADAAVEAVEPARWERAASLFVRWREGDSRAMDDLVRLMTPPLWHVVRAYGLDAALAQDVVQTTWLTLVRRHESILDPQAISGWLTMCARREAWRVSKLHRRADPTDVDVLEAHLPAHESAEQTAADAGCLRSPLARRGKTRRTMPAPAAGRRVRRPARLRTHRRGLPDADRVHRADASALSRQAPRLTRGRRMGRK